MKFPRGINSHLAGFVSKCEAAPIYEELLGAPLTRRPLWLKGH